MDTKDAKKENHPVPDLSDNYDYLKASSVTDCTGAMPRPPQNSAELDSYLDVYNFLPQSAFAKPSPLAVDMLHSGRRGKQDPAPYRRAIAAERSPFPFTKHPLQEESPLQRMFLL